jgi:hypothetical protein
MIVRSIVLFINISSLVFLFVAAVLYVTGGFSFEVFKICSLICTLTWFSGSLVARWLKNKRNPARTES